MKPQETAASKILEAMKAYKSEETFTSNDIAEMSEIRKGRVQLYVSAYAKQGKIILVNKSQYPYVYRWPSPSELSVTKKEVKLTQKTKKKLDRLTESKTDPLSDLPIGYDPEQSISPLQIGLGIIGLIQSLKNGGDHDVKSLKLRIKELEGTLNHKDRELNEKKMQLAEFRIALTRKDRQIDLLSSHLGVLSKGSGISIKDIIDKA
jgi:uncharacterized coiled-coil protein SlyX